MVVTRLTRNQLTGNTVRGFESLHLRQKGPPFGGPFWRSEVFEYKSNTPAESFIAAMPESEPY